MQAASQQTPSTQKPLGQPLGAVQPPPIAPASSSALVRTLPSPIWPPAASTLPFASTVAVWRSRLWFIVAPGDHVPVASSYTSVVARVSRLPSSPPVTSTLLPASRTAA